MTKTLLLRLLQIVAVSLVGSCLVGSVACSRDAAPAATKTVETLDPSRITVEHPDLFHLVKIESRDLPIQLNVNGSVTPDVNRTVHVTSQGSGRVVEIRARLGDFVQKGQVLLVVASADLGGANSDYQKAVADERLAHKTLERAQVLLEHGAAAAKDVEIAQDGDDKAKVDVKTTGERVRLLGGNPDQPGSLISLRAPVSGTIVEQNVAGNEGIKSLDNTPNLFTIADLSRLWVLCDVYENDLGLVHIGDAAEVHLNAFPDRVFHGRVSDLSRVLDPNTRSAKARIELENVGGALRPGMFATVRFRSSKTESAILIPAAAILRLQDKDWVFRQEDATHFRKLEVQASDVDEKDMLKVTGTLHPGDSIAANALEFSAAVAEK